MDPRNASGLGDERRRFARVPLSTQATLEWAGQEYILASRNISECGMGADAAEGLPPQTEGLISFNLKPEDVPLVCRCRVLYSTDGRGAGIEFLELSEESRLILKHFVDQAN
ncbi:MAG: PilZ domain-containing protein [Terriglobia bacterium]